MTILGYKLTFSKTPAVKIESNKCQTVEEYYSLPVMFVIKQYIKELCDLQFEKNKNKILYTLSNLMTEAEVYGILIDYKTHAFFKEAFYMLTNLDNAKPLNRRDMIQKLTEISYKVASDESRSGDALYQELYEAPMVFKPTCSGTYTEDCTDTNIAVDSYHGAGGTESLEKVESDNFDDILNKVWDEKKPNIAKTKTIIPNSDEDIDSILDSINSK